MNVDEKIAFDYLVNLGKETPEFEPNGKRPPDYSLGDIGVEVRRLNQNIFIGGKAIGPENMDLNFPQIIEKVLRGFDSHYSGKSFWLSIKYRRSMINNIRVVKKELKQTLHKYLIVKPILPCTIEIVDGIEINFYDCDSSSSRTFQIFSLTDYDSGVWVLSTYLQNIKYSIQIKRRKIHPYEKEYNRWWLLLVDRIGFRFHDDEIQELKSYIGEIQFFEKVIVINPISLNLVLEFGL